MVNGCRVYNYPVTLKREKGRDGRDGRGRTWMRGDQQNSFEAARRSGRMLMQPLKVDFVRSSLKPELENTKDQAEALLL